MNYLSKYGSRRKFQGGGEMPVDPGMVPAAGPAEGGGQEEQILALAQAASSGDQQAAMELGMLVAPMIMQEMQAAGGAPQEAAPEAQPVFRRGGVFIGKIK